MFQIAMRSTECLRIDLLITIFSAMLSIRSQVP